METKDKKKSKKQLLKEYKQLVGDSYDIEARIDDIVIELIDRFNLSISDIVSPTN